MTTKRRPKKKPPKPDSYMTYTENGPRVVNVGGTLVEIPATVAATEIEARRLKFMIETAAIVAEGGTRYVGVFPVEKGPKEYHFAYTVGRTGRGLPELFVTGVSSQCEGLFALLEQAWATYPGPGVSWEILPGGHFMLLPLPLGPRNDHMTITRSIVGEDFSALQVVWTDNDGRWPWDRLPDPTLPVLGILG